MLQRMVAANLTTSPVEAPQSSSPPPADHENNVSRGQVQVLHDYTSVLFLRTTSRVIFCTSEYVKQIK